MRWRLLVLGLFVLVLGSCSGDQGAGGPQASVSTHEVPGPRSLSPDGSDRSTGGGGSGDRDKNDRDKNDRDKNDKDKDKNTSDNDDDEGRDGKPVNPAGVETTARAEAAATLPRNRVECPPGGREVTTATQLQDALDAAAPGSVIRLADGTYEGSFRADRSGTAEQPVWLCGGSGAVLQGEGVKSGYVLHLDGATHWRLVGFTVRDGQKGVMADGTVGSVIQGLTVETMGDEGIHLRRHSTDNLVIGNTVRNTGLRRDKFGEGIYIGSAVSNWCRISDCGPDRSDRNVIAENRIGPTTSESIDIKEGTVGGLVVGNRFDGSGTTAADSWVDVKGTAWLIEDNAGTAAPLDGFQTHQILDRWGERNLFRGNAVTAGTVPAALADDADERFGFAFRPDGGNALTCDNRSSGIPLANVDCTR